VPKRRAHVGPILILSLTIDRNPKGLARADSPPRTWDRQVVVVATVGIMLGCAIAVWWGLASTLGKPSWTVMSYHVVDDRSVDVTYLVSRPTGSRHLRDHRPGQQLRHVGLIDVTVPPSGETSVRRTTRVHTTTRPSPALSSPAQSPEQSR